MMVAALSLVFALAATPATVSVVSQALPLDQAIDQLGSLEFSVRTEASRVVRRTPAAQAVPALIEAAANHRDGYVRFRALVLLTGFNDARAESLMLQLLTDPNDRVRAVAYGWFGINPNPRALDVMLDALEDEASEFVRPALTRAVAAYDTPEVRTAMTALVGRGQDFFRSVVIEALGEHEATYAADAIAAVARLDGPLQDDAVLALGRVGDPSRLGLLAELQRSAPRENQPAIATAICLLGTNCNAHERYLADMLRFAIDNPDYQPMLRGSANGLAALAVAGHESAFATLVDAGLPSRDPARAAIALALGTVALRSPQNLLEWTSTRADGQAVAELLRESFDMLDEDLEEERFYAAVRRRYWEAPEGSALRQAAETLIKVLEF